METPLNPQKNRNGWLLFGLIYLIAAILHAYAETYTDTDSILSGVGVIGQGLFVVLIVRAMFRPGLKALFGKERSLDEFELMQKIRAYRSAGPLFVLYILAICMPPVLFDHLFGEKAQAFALQLIFGTMMMYFILASVMFWHRHPNAKNGISSP